MLLNSMKDIKPSPLLSRTLKAKLDVASTLSLEIGALEIEVAVEMGPIFVDSHKS